MWDKSVQISPNELTSSNNAVNRIEKNVIQLIKSFINKPLLLEKLILNQNQGLLLKLNNQSTQLNLQLPLKLTNIIDSIITKNMSSLESTNSQLNTTNDLAPKLRLSITNKNQIKLTIFQEKTTNAKATNLKPSNSLRQTNPNPKPTNLPLQAPQATSSQIKKAQIGGSQVINSQTIGAQLNISQNVKTGQSNSQSVNAILFQNAKATKNGSIKLDNPSIVFNKIVTNATNKSSLSTTISSPISTNINPLDVTKSPQNIPVTVGTVAKELLANHFSKQLPLSQPLNQLIRISKKLTHLSPLLPEAKVLSQQIKQLTSILQKPKTFSANDIKQQINNSGHLAETNIVKNIKNDTQLSHKDLKIALLKIQSQLESMILKSSQPIKTNLLEDAKNLTIKTPSNLTQPTLPTQSASSVRSSTSFQSILTIPTLTSESTSTSSSILKPTSSVTPSLTPMAASNFETKEQSFNITNLTHQKNMATNIQNKNQQISQQTYIFKQSTEMLKEVKSSIKQIESNQLLSLRNEPVNLQQFLVDLPLASHSKIDSFELLFEENCQDGKAKKKKWKVVVRFDLEPLGPMFAQVELQGERISTHIFSESKQTAQLINEHMHVLKQSLFSAGVEVDELKSTQGNVPEKLLINDDRIIDTHI